MGQHTNIEWCDSTANPTGFQCCGCELWNPKRGLRNCYAGRQAERYGGIGAFDKPVVLKPGVMAAAAQWRDLRGVARPDKPWVPAAYPRIIFLGDMADVLQPGVPFEFLRDEVVSVAASEAGRRHIWMLLTKQAKRLLQFDIYLHMEGLAWPRNLWAGVSVTSNKTLWRVAPLTRTRAAVRYVSYEPAFEWVDFSRHLASGQLHQIIIGGESGADARVFSTDWAAELIAQCRAAGVAPFVKQLGSRACAPVARGEHRPLEHLNLKHKKGGDWNEWPPELRVREFPPLESEAADARV